MTLLPQLRNINYLSSVHTTCMPRDCLIDFLHFFSLFIGCKKKKKSFSTWNIGIECLYLQQLCFVIRFFVSKFHVSWIIIGLTGNYFLFSIF